MHKYFKKLLLSNVDVDTSTKDYRRLIAANFTIIFGAFIFLFFSYFNFTNDHIKLFYVDITAFTIIVFLYFFFRKIKNIIFIANITITLAFFGSFLAIYLSKAADYSPLWNFVYLFYSMILLGHKKGAISSILLFMLTFFMMYFWVGEHISYYEFIRYMVISFVLIIISYVYEFSTQKTFIELENLNETLNKLSKTDSLTTLYNRRYFDEIFTKEIDIAKRNQNLLAFAIIDIDNFKSYNDTYGHQSGDEVLKMVSAKFIESMRRLNDYAFRLGGEEFGLLFLTQTKQDAINIFEQVRKNIEDLKIANSANTVSPFITVSIGLYIAVPNRDDDSDYIYKITDDALYNSKNSGKNKIYLAP